MCLVRVPDASPKVRSGGDNAQPWNVKICCVEVISAFSEDGAHEFFCTAVIRKVRFERADDFHEAFDSQSILRGPGGQRGKRLCDSRARELVQILKCRRRGSQEQSTIEHLGSTGRLIKGRINVQVWHSDPPFPIGIGTGQAGQHPPIFRRYTNTNLVPIQVTMRHLVSSPQTCNFTPRACAATIQGQPFNQRAITL